MTKHFELSLSMFSYLLKQFTFILSQKFIKQNDCKILTTDEKSGHQEKGEGADEFREEGGEGCDHVYGAEDEHNCQCEES